MTPRQLGPTSRIPASRQIAVICSSILRPSPPTSLKPADTITIPLIPIRADSITAFRASGGGRMMIPRSTGSGMSEIAG